MRQERAEALEPDAEDERGGGPPTYSVPAVAKALGILELLAGEAGGLSMTDLSARLGRSMGSIYRIVLELHRHGYLLKDPATDRYALSLKLFELANRHPPTERLVRLADPVLQELAAGVDQSCHLGVLLGDELLVLAKADNPLPMHYSVKLGARFPALETSSGVVIWAFRPKKERSALLRTLEGQARLELKERFGSVRAVGFERRASAVVTGVTNLSAPIFDHAGSAIAALTVPYLAQLRQRASVEEAERRLLAAASALNRALGAPDATPDGKNSP